MKSNEVPDRPVLTLGVLAPENAAREPATCHALYHQVARVQLPFVRHGRLLRFDRLALDRWLE